MDILVLAESDPPYSVCNIHLCVQVRESESKKEREREKKESAVNPVVIRN
jgi:hypothetical protein